MPRETLSAELPYATKSQNTPGASVPTPIVEWDLPDDLLIRLSEGLPVVFDVEDANGNDLSRGARIGLGVQEPNDPLDAFTVLSDQVIGPFNSLSLKDQQSGDNAERRRLSFDDERVPATTINIEDSDTLALLLDADSTIDTSTLVFNYEVETISR